MGSYSPEAWARLGDLLAARRVHIDPRYRHLKVFVDEVGLDGINLKLLSEIENAKRDNYRPATLALIEHAYQWEPGSIRAVLEGGDPVPAAVTVRRPAQQADDMDLWVAEIRELVEGVPAADRDRALAAGVAALKAVLRSMARDRSPEDRSL